jgi:uncharacterized membrane protein
MSRGILWIGHLYFFNFVNAQLAKTYDADSKKKVVPELMPRALYFFRWGAAYTWVTGFLLMGLVYYMQGASQLRGAEPRVEQGPAIMISLALVLVVFFYDALWKALAKTRRPGGGVLRDRGRLRLRPLASSADGRLHHPRACSGRSWR